LITTLIDVEKVRKFVRVWRLRLKFETSPFT
jgi:hypothetical protein